MQIAALTLHTHVLSQQREFYADLLGLPVIRRTAASFAVRAGTTELTFEQGPAGWQGHYHFAFNVPPERFERARAWMAALTPLLEDHAGRDIFAFRTWHADACYFHDPAGNVGELIARHDLPGGAEGPILSVSEIGVVVDSVTRFVHLLEVEAGLTAFRDTIGESFAAVGDDSGLFILVPPGRAWYPDTGKRSVLAPLTVDFLDPKGQNRRLEGPPYRLVGLPPAGTSSA